MKQLPKVFVVHDSLAVSSSIEVILNALSYEVKCFASVEEFIAEHDPTHIGCIVVDLLTLGIRGSELIRHLHETQSLLSVVIISGLIEAAARHQHKIDPLPVVAEAYEVVTLLTMIEDAMAGSLKRDLAVVQTISDQTDQLQHFSTNDSLNIKVMKLSPRQRQVLSCLLAGDTLKAAAQKLGISEHTVGDYVKRIYKHFSVCSRAELLAQFISGEQP